MRGGGGGWPWLCAMALRQLRQRSPSWAATLRSHRHSAVDFSCSPLRRCACGVWSDAGAAAAGAAKPLWMNGAATRCMGRAMDAAAPARFRTVATERNMVSMGMGRSVSRMSRMTMREEGGRRQEMSRQRNSNHPSNWFNTMFQANSVAEPYALTV